MLVGDEVQHAVKAGLLCFGPDRGRPRTFVVQVMSVLVEDQPLDDLATELLASQDGERGHEDPALVQPGMSQASPAGHLDAEALPEELASGADAPRERVGDAP